MGVKGIGILIRDRDYPRRNNISGILAKLPGETLKLNGHQVKVVSLTGNSNLTREVLKMAFRGQVAVFFGGVARSEAKEKEFAQRWFKVNKPGHFYGLENAFANSFCRVAEQYLASRCGRVEEYQQTKTSFLVDLSRDQIVQNYWGKIKQEGALDFLGLVGEINEELHNLSSIKIKEAIDRLQGQPNFNNRGQWTALLEKLMRSMAGMASFSLSNLRAIERILSGLYLDKAIKEFRGAVLGDYRNELAIKVVRETAKNLPTSLPIIIFADETRQSGLANLLKYPRLIRPWEKY